MKTPKLSQTLPANALYAISELKQMISPAIAKKLNKRNAAISTQLTPNGELNFTLIQNHIKFDEFSSSKLPEEKFAKTIQNNFDSSCKLDISEKTYNSSTKEIPMFLENKIIQTTINPFGRKDIWAKQLEKFVENCNSLVENINFIK